MNIAACALLACLFPAATLATTASVATYADLAAAVANAAVGALAPHALAHE